MTYRPYAQGWTQWRGSRRMAAGAAQGGQSFTVPWDDSTFSLTAGEYGFGLVIADLV